MEKTPHQKKGEIMKNEKEIYTIAVILMILSLVLGSWTIYHVHAEGEEIEQTQETTQNTENNSTTIDETKQIVEEISTKIDKVDDAIASQKVDSQKIEQQAIDIEELKEQLGEVKATLATVTVPGANDTTYDLGNPYEFDKMIPLRLNIPIYKYLYTHATQSSNGQVTYTYYIIVSNSDSLNLVYSDVASSGSRARGISGIYTENNGDLKQPIVGIRVDDGITTREEAIQLLTDPNNWGYVKQGITANTIEASRYFGFFKRSSTERVKQYMVVPAGGEYNENTNGAEYYTGIALMTTSDLGAAAPYRALSPITILDQNKIELLPEDQPEEQEWNVQELYIPVMVIMSVLIIMLFKKK